MARAPGRLAGVEGGGARITDARLAEISSRGGEMESDQLGGSLDRAAARRAVLLDLTPRQLLALADDRLTGPHQAALRRFRYGAGMCKIERALSGPVPWPAPASRQAGTVHLGGNPGRDGSP